MLYYPLTMAIFFIVAQIAQAAQAHLNKIGWATWAICPAIKKYGLSTID